MGLLDEDVLDELLSPANLLQPRYRDANVYSGSDPSVEVLQDPEEAD